MPKRVRTKQPPVSKSPTLTSKVWSHRKKRKAMLRDSRKHSRGKK